MQKVTSYKTSDGILHTDKLAATFHEAELSLKAQIKTEYEPIFKAAPDAARLLQAMVAEPEYFIAALQTFAKIKRKADAVANAAETRILGQAA